MSSCAAPRTQGQRDWLSTQEVADVLQVSRPYVAKIIDAGELPSFKVGTHRRVLRHDFEIWRSFDDARRRLAMLRLTRAGEELEAHE